MKLGSPRGRATVNVQHKLLSCFYRKTSTEPQKTGDRKCSVFMPFYLFFFIFAAGMEQYQITLRLTCSTKKERKSSINLSGYAQFEFSSSLKYACVLFFLCLVVKQSAGLHLYTQQALLCLTLHCTSVGTSFLDSSPVNIAREAIWCM